MKLYTYFRSSAAYRVRIALNLKGLAYDSIPVHLVRDGGEQHSTSYHSLNPTELIPTWQDQFITLGQSLTIIEYLDEQYPDTLTLLPKDIITRARVRSFAQSIACDIHPINNLRVLQYLQKNFAADEAQINQWYTYWIAEGFNALEAQLTQRTSQDDFCFGEQATVADCCLAPQVYNARRYNMDISKWPHIERINQHCLAQQAFIRAQPENQVDTP